MYKVMRRDSYLVVVMGGCCRGKKMSSLSDKLSLKTFRQRCPDTEGNRDLELGRDTRARHRLRSPQHKEMITKWMRSSRKSTLNRWTEPEEPRKETEKE